MKKDYKKYIYLTLSLFILWFVIHYWHSFTIIINLLLVAMEPIIIGAVIAYIVNIPMTFFEWHFPKTDNKILNKSKRLLCMLAAIISFVIIVALLCVIVIPELISALSVLSKGIPQVIDFITSNETIMSFIPEDTLAQIQAIDEQQLVDSLVNLFLSGAGDITQSLIGFLSSALATISTFVIAIIFSIYLLIGKETLLKQIQRFMNVYFKPQYKNTINLIFTTLNNSFHKFIVGQCIEAMIIGILCMIGMFILQFPYASMIGMLIGFTALIPVAGAYIGAAVGAVMIMTVSPSSVIPFLIYIVVLQQFEGNIIYPRVVGTSLGLPGLWVLAAVTVGGSIFGILGMLVAVPLVSAIYNLIKMDMNAKEMDLQ